jgi:hypothetical protein
MHCSPPASKALLYLFLDSPHSSSHSKWRSANEISAHPEPIDRKRKGQKGRNGRETEHASIVHWKNAENSQVTTAALVVVIPAPVLR